MKTLYILTGRTGTRIETVCQMVGRENIIVTDLKIAKQLKKETINREVVVIGLTLSEPLCLARHFEDTRNEEKILSTIKADREAYEGMEEVCDYVICCNYRIKDVAADVCAIMDKQPRSALFLTCKHDFSRKTYLREERIYVEPTNSYILDCVIADNDGSFENKIQNKINRISLPALFCLTDQIIDKKEYKGEITIKDAWVAMTDRHTFCGDPLYELHVLLEAGEKDKNRLKLLEKGKMSLRPTFVVDDKDIITEEFYESGIVPCKMSTLNYPHSIYGFDIVTEPLDYNFNLEETSHPISNEGMEANEEVSDEEASYHTETFFVKNNEFDKHNRRFSTDVLYKLADMLTGKTSGPFLIKNAYVKFTDKMTKAGPPLCELYAEIITPSDFDAEGKTLYVELNYQCVQSFLDDAGCEILVNDVEDFFFKTDEKTFSVPVLWTLSAKVTVKGKNLSEAVSKVTDPSFKLPKNGEYLKDSFCVDHEGIEEIKEG